MYVEVRNNNLDRSLRLLKRKLAEDGLFNILRQKQAYEKPSDRKRREKRAAIARERRAMRDRAD